MMPLIKPHFPEIIHVLSQMGAELPESVSYLAKFLPYLPLNKIMSKLIQTLPQVPQDFWQKFLIRYRRFKPRLAKIMPHISKVGPFLPDLIPHLPRILKLSPILRIYVQKFYPYFAKVAPRYDEILSRIVPHLSEILPLFEEIRLDLTENVAPLTQVLELLHSQIDPIMLPYLSSSLPKNINYNT